MKERKETNFTGHLSPDLGMVDTRSRSWKTLLLAPAAFIAVVYSPDNEDIEDPTAGEYRHYKCYFIHNLKTPFQA